MEMKGLSDAEVKERKDRGEVNSVEPIVSRSYKDIFLKNTFTPFNLILFAIGAILLIFQEYRDAFAATGIIILNIIGISALSVSLIRVSFGANSLS